METVQAHELKIGDRIYAEGRKLRVTKIQNHRNEGALLFTFYNYGTCIEHQSLRSKIEIFEIIPAYISSNTY